MAKTVVPIELSSTPGIVDNSNATAITIDSSEDVTLAGHIVLTDSKEVKLGASTDLRLYHDSNHSYIVNATGDLVLHNNADDKDIILKSDDGSGGATAYITVDGSATTTVFSKNTRHADNALIQVGDGNDAAFYHNSSDNNTYFTNDTGDLKFRQFADDKDIIFDCDDGSGGVERYLTLDGSAKFVQFDQHTKHSDAIKLDLGNSSDLQIYHSGSHSYIENNTGDLVLLNNADDKDIIFQSDDGSGGTQTYLTIDGSADRTVFSRSSRHSDNVVATFGTGEDLQIYHDGSNSYVADGGTGHLILKGTNMNLQAANGESYIFAAENAGVTLYYDGSSKLATNTNGVEITGSFYFGDSEEALFGAGNDMQIYHNGTDSYIKNATGTLKIATETSGIAVTIGHSTSEVTVADNLTVTGNLTVSGTTTTVNSTTLDVADLNITVGKSATTSSATDGAGLTFGAWSSGTIPTLTWDHSNTRLSVNKPFNVTGALTVDDITINGSTISDGGDLTVDVTGVLNLDATTQIILKDDGTNYGTFYQSSSDFYIQSLVQDKDIVLYGNDGGSGIAALTLDMSDAGTATFNHDVKLGDDSELVLGAGSDLKFYHSSSVNYIKTNSDLPLKIWDAGGAGILEMTPNGKVGIFHNGSEKIYTTSTGAVIAHTSDTDYSSTGEPAGILTLYNSNGSDGAGVNNYSSLEFNTGDGATSQGFINYVRTADNQGSFAFSQRTGSSSYAESMRIDNSGNVGIGITTPNESGFGATSRVLSIAGTAQDAFGVLELISTDVTSSNRIGEIRFGNLDAGSSFASNAGIRAIRDGADNSSALSLWTTNAGTFGEVITIKSDGKVGINNSSPLSHLTFESDHWNTGTEDGPSIRWNNGITTADSVLQNFEDSNVAPFVLGMNSYVSSGGSFTTFNNSYAASYIYQGASGAITMGTSSSGTATERMQIKNSGEVLIGTTSALSNAKLTVDGGDMMVQAANNSCGISDLLPGYTRGDYGVIYSTANHIYFKVGSSYISYINGGDGTFNVSDSRIKENIATLTGTLDKVKQLRGVSFTWKDTEERGTDTKIGLIAQEVEAVYPQLVDDGALPKDNDGNDPLKSVNYAHLTSVLIEAIKELSTELDAAKARITTLEG